ncbi:MAG: hypothetical protein M3198_00100 [Actinomycetota bacterium]|nr:hypothetical protein [Actinomycetota bacterium]
MRNEDCSHTAVFEPNLHYEAAPGRWEKVDLTFRAEGNNFVADRHSLRVQAGVAGVSVTDPRRGRGIRWLTPVEPQVTDRAARFSHDGLVWKYTPTRSGVKLTADVEESRGARTYEFRYQLLGGASELTVDAGGNLHSDAFAIPRAAVYGADQELYDGGRWQIRDDNRVAFEFDDSTLPAEAFPYVLDPTTTFRITATGDDGYLSAYGGYSYSPACDPNLGWHPTSPMVFVYKGRNSSGQFNVHNGFTKWDTSSLPDDAVIDAATLRLAVDDAESPEGRNLTADWYNWSRIECSDFSESAQTTALQGVPLNAIADSPNGTFAINDFVLSGYGANVSRTGYTGLRLHVSGGQPTAENFIKFASLEATYPEINPPAQLVVTYTIPNYAPSILSASDSPDPVTEGRSVNFNVSWADQPGDAVKVLICKSSWVTSFGTCGDGRWTGGDLYYYSSPTDLTYTTSGADLGTRAYYAFACDDQGACSSGTYGTFQVIANRGPYLSSATDSPDPVAAGGRVDFELSWSDPDGDAVRGLVCKTSSVSGGNCSAGAWSTTAGSTFTSPIRLSYMTTSSDIGTRSYSAYICDPSNVCSGRTGTFTVNTPPAFTSVADWPDPVTEGNTVNFNVGWNDPGDSVRAVICRTNAIASGVCQGGGLGSGGLSQSSPSSATYSTRASDAGTMTYYAFACDSSNACSSGVAGSLTVNALPPPDAPDITATPEDPTRAPTLTFAFQGQSGVSFECSLTGPSGTVAPYAPCSSPKGYGSSGLSPGLYMFEVRAVSNAGRRSDASDAEIAVHYGGDGQELEASPYEDDADVAGERAEQYAGSRHGGSWTTYRRDQTIDVHVGVVGMTPIDELLIETFSTDGVVINAERVKYAYADLLRFAETVSPVDKTRRYMVGIDVESNRLILEVEDPTGTESGTPAVDLGTDIPADAVDARWVRSAALTPFSANTRSTFPTYKAGKRYGLKEGGKAECGVAFAMVLENGNKLGLTAGHCGDEEDEIYMGTNRGKRVGRIFRDGEHGQDVVVSDTALVTVADEHMTRNVHINRGFSRMVVKADRSIEKGDMVCLSGSISGIDCGHVRHFYTNAWAGFGYQWKNIWCADIDEAVLFDSGSPIYRPIGKPVHDQHGTRGEAKAIGVLVGGTIGEPNDIACFEAIGQAETQRGAVVWES